MRSARMLRVRGRARGPVWLDGPAPPSPPHPARRACPQVEAASYRNIALSLGVDSPADILFATDNILEARAAGRASLCTRCAPAAFASSFRPLPTPRINTRDGARTHPPHALSRRTRKCLCLPLATRLVGVQLGVQFPGGGAAGANAAGGAAGAARRPEWERRRPALTSVVDHHHHPSPPHPPALRARTNGCSMQCAAGPLRPPTCGSGWRLVLPPTVSCTPCCIPCAC